LSTDRHHRFGPKLSLFSKSRAFATAENNYFHCVFKNCQSKFNARNVLSNGKAGSAFSFLRL
jgi:hypothetical protein